MTTVEILKSLIKIPSYVDREMDERDMVVKMKSLFAGSRYKVEEQVLKGKRKNLFIHDGTTPKIILLGHTDTVPLKKETKGSSFDPRVVGKKLFGLGSGDMKAGLAIAAHQMLINKKTGLALIASVDEEYNCSGARAFVQKYKLHPRMIVNLEPTDLEILNGCRGILEFTFEVRGVAAHAAKKHLGINAIEKSAIISAELQKELTKLDIPNGPRNSVNHARLLGGNLMEYDAQGNPLISASGNVVPDYAYNHCEVRTASSKVNLVLVEKLLNKIAKKHGVRIEKLALRTDVVGSMFVPQAELKEFEKAIKNSGLPVIYQSINDTGYVEAQLFREAWGSPVVIFGPGPTLMMHKANEYVDLSTVAKTEQVVAKYLEYNL